MKIIIDDALPARQLYPLLLLICLLLCITALRLILSFSAEYLYSWAGNHLVRDIRIELFQHLLNLPIGFQHRQQTGELVFRLNSDVGVVQSVVTSSVLRFVHSVLTLVGLVAVLCSLDTTLFLFSTSVIPFFILNLLFFQPRIRKVAESLQEQGAALSSFAIERFNNVPLIQIFNGQDYEASRFRSALNGLIATAMRSVRYSISMATVSSGLVVVAPAVILGWGGYQVMKGAITLGTLIAVLQYTRLLFGPVQGLHDLYADLVRGLVSMRRVLEFTRIPTQEATHKGCRTFVYNHTIEFQDVHFRYDSQPVLQGLNFRLTKGRTYALVGVSGSGKTTLAHLLCGFYRADQGRILVDGVPLEEISLRDLREHVGLVSQQVHLFDVTIRDNILYGFLEEEPAEVEQVIEEVGLSGLHLEEKIGEQGMQLSGGQQQRVALARTLLRRLDLLILDEATSALDAESEEEILFRVRQRFRARTILLISHRLSAVQGVDEVICLFEGRVVEQGPPAHLLARQGYYARYVQKSRQEGARSHEGAG